MDFNSWIDIKTTKTTDQSIKKKKTGRTVNKIFNDILNLYLSQIKSANLEVDLKLKQFLSDAIYNKFPENVYYSSKNLVIKKGKNINSICLNENINENLKNIISFIQTYDIIKEDKSSNEIYEPKLYNISNFSWNDIKKKNIKEFKIYEYIKKLAKQYNLRDIEIEYLKSNIFIGLNDKTITKNNIIFENGQIQDINNLHKYEHENYFYIE